MRSNLKQREYIWHDDINQTARSSQDQIGKRLSGRHCTKTLYKPDDDDDDDDDDDFVSSEFENHSHHRPPPASQPSAAASAMGEGTQQPQPVIHFDVEPAPRAWTRMQMLALAAILVLGGLKYLPAATHFCHRGRNWTSFDPSRHPADLSHQVGGVDFVEKKVGCVDILSWISCLDLRALAVLTNSTLSSSSQPDDVSFSFLIPEGGNDQLPFYKIKSVLPDSNITVTSQKQIKDKLNVATPQGNSLWSFRNELPPIIIAATGFSRKRYVYISADSVVKGKVEDLVRIDLGSYAIGAAEDCSKRLGDYASMDVLNVVQRTHRDLVYTESYDKDACLLDFDILLVEPRNLKRNLIDSIKLWTMAVNLPNSRDAIRVAMTLAFYGNYLKLPTNWKRANESTDILYYDGPKNVCYESGHKHREKASGKAWQQYLSQKSEVGWDIPDVCDCNCK
uniref:Uncharacterized protein n=1 Tax=Avena sativa TaxID=4498 RepID=A0ACD5WBT4_AVESA